MALGLTSVAVVIMLVGCAGKYGSFKRDTEVKQAFETNQVPADYKYYYYGYSTEPYVIFGIEAKYELNSNMWREVAPNTAEFKELARWIWEDYNYYKFGANIFDPAGKKVGVMYTSIYETSVKFGDDNRIAVIPGTPFLWGPDDIGAGGVRAR